MQNTLRLGNEMSENGRQEVNLITVNNESMLTKGGVCPSKQQHFPIHSCDTWQLSHCADSDKKFAIALIISVLEVKMEQRMFKTKHIADQPLQHWH